MNHVTRRTLLIFITIQFVIHAPPVQSQTHGHGDHALGAVDFPISCTKSSQAEFNRGMTLLHHMTYPQAREVFEELVKRDSLCPMAHWGIAMTLFQPVWPTRPSPAALQRGWELTQKAKLLRAPTLREQLLIEAASAFFLNPESGDYWKRIRSWADGMEKCYSAFPEDPEVAALYALSLVATVPPDQITSTNNDRAAEILLRILKENPHHPGAMHYLIHANDAPGRERESLDILRKYEAIAPDNPHALHMPTHIYTRLGNWPEVIRGNIRAAQAALNFPAGDHGQFVWDEFPHAIEYLVYAYLQRGDDDSAAAQLKRLHGTPGLEPTFKTAFHLSSTQARYALERKDWKEAASIVPRESDQVDWNKFPWPEAISWFSRGLGSVHTNNLSEAKVSLSRLAELEERSRNAQEELFMRNIRVLRLGLSAWVADKEGERDSSISLMIQAAELETSTPKHAVTPGPTLPAYELLGDLLLEQGKPSDALSAYERSLESYPRRFNSLLGAARASAAGDSKPSAMEYYRQLLDVTGQGSHREALREAREFLSR